MQVVAVACIFVVEESVLVAQSDTGVAPLAEVAAILGKGGDAVLRDVSIGVGDGLFINPVGIMATVLLLYKLFYRFCGVSWLLCPCCHADKCEE